MEGQTVTVELAPDEATILYKVLEGYAETGRRMAQVTGWVYELELIESIVAKLQEGLA